MCLSRRLIAAFHVLWSLVYICTGAIQLVAGIFFLISLPIFKVGSNIWTGTWNILVGIGAAMLACVGDLTAKKQESLLYIAISILVTNVVNIVILELGEWHFFMSASVQEIINQKNLKKLIFYAHITTSVSTTVAIITSFLDSQFTYCSMQRTQKPKNVHEQVSDIEYIIPRKKSSVAKQAQNIYSQYAQSWVFDTDTTGSSKTESPYLKLPNGSQYDLNKSFTLRRYDVNRTFTLRRHTVSNPEICSDEQHIADQKMFVVNPIVHVEPVSDESNGDRSLNYMKSFSRTPSPAGVSESSSQDSSFNPPIYECLERLTEPALYRSRLNTAISLNAEQNYYQSPRSSETHSSEIIPALHTTRPRSETFTKERLVVGEGMDTNEKVQYASLMVELQQAFRSKKDKFTQPTSPKSMSESLTVEDISDKTQSESKASSCHESSQDTSQRTDKKGSDAEFSKELEAALQLIQDLESPNTIETPSETCRSIDGGVLPGGSVPIVSVKWRDSDASESTKTLSECVSPVDLPEEEEAPTTTSSTTEIPQQGKGTSIIVVAPTGSGSQSSSGYSSPSPGNSKRPTPFSSKAPSVSGSSGNLATADQTLSYAIRNSGSAAIISLFSPSGTLQRKSVTSISGPEVITDKKPPREASSSRNDTIRIKVESNNNHVYKRIVPPAHHPETIIEASVNETVVSNSKKELSNGVVGSQNGTNTTLTSGKNNSEVSPQSTLGSSSSRWNVKSLLRKKTSPPVLTPELESAIFKSESLAYLTELELLARHARNKSIQRQIEQRVQQQILGQTPSESHC
ncbi:serine-rich adhesin for platelets isoform X2 [Anabrus simplex]